MSDVDGIITVRRLEQDDLPRLQRLFEQIDDTTAGADALSHADLDDPSFHVIAARVGGEDTDELVGIATCVRIPKLDPRRGFLFIDELHVLEPYRRRGVARALLDAITRTAHEIGCHGVRLVVWPDNEPARRLYRDLGFEESEAIFCQRNEAE